MKKLCVGTLMGILLITFMAPLAYAQGSCCPSGSACCPVPNVSASQNQARSAAPVAPQTKAVIVNPALPQLNTMPWAAATNQIGNLQQVAPAAPAPQPQLKLNSNTNALTVIDMLAAGPFFGTLW